jgi:hypothetical protein
MALTVLELQISNLGPMWVLFEIIHRLQDQRDHRLRPPAGFVLITQKKLVLVTTLSKFWKVVLVLLQGYLAHKRRPSHLGPPHDPRHGPAVGSQEGGVFNELGIVLL